MLGRTLRLGVPVIGKLCLLGGIAWMGIMRLLVGPRAWLGWGHELPYFVKGAALFGGGLFVGLVPLLCGLSLLGWWWAGCPSQWPPARNLDIPSDPGLNPDLDPSTSEALS